MVIAVGWGGQARDLGEGPIAECPNCHNIVGFRVVETSRKASVMFIRVAKWDKEYWVVCPTCERGGELSSREKAQRFIADAMQANAALIRLAEEAESAPDG